LCLSFAAAQTYCSSGPTTTVDSNLGLTVLIGDTKSINEDSNCPGSVGPRDLTNYTADLGRKNYTLTTTVTTCGNNFPTLTGAWIDWNNNFLFEDNEKKVGEFSTLKNVSWTFAVPQDAVKGKLRLRVQTQETQATTLNPCANFPYGATKDFTVDVGGNNGDAYCISGPLTTDDSNLGGVTFVGESRNIREASDCPGQLGPQNFLDLEADVVRGGQYTLTFSVTSCGERYATTSGAWIDWEHDLVLSTSDALGYTNQQGVVSINFTVPQTTYLGPTVLRVQVQEISSTKIDPCAQFSYGGTKDFTVNIAK